MNSSESNSNPVGRPPRDGEAADGHIHLRVTMARKNAYVRAAKPKKLSEWIIEQLDKDAKFNPEPHMRESIVSVEVTERNGRLLFLVNHDYADQLRSFLENKGAFLEGPYEYKNKLFVVEKDGRKQFREVNFVDGVIAKGTMEQGDELAQEWLDTI
jgi:hypothetical protein